MAKPKSDQAPRDPSRWVRFNRRYDHTWPSRAVTHYKPGYEGRVKGEVATAAIAAGAAEEIESPPRGAETLDTSPNSQ